MQRSADTQVSSDHMTASGEQQRRVTHRPSAIAIALWVIGVVVFGAVCIVIHAHPMPWPVELSVTQALQGPHLFPCSFAGQSQNLIEMVSTVIDTLNGPLLAVLLPALWIIGLMLVRWRWQALFLGIAVVTGAGLWFLLEVLVGRPRPATAEGICVQRILPVHSFPSGHVIHDVILYGFLLYLSFSQPVQRWRYRWVLLPLQVLAVCYLLAVGYSRLELGEHWLFDVLGAYLVAVLWLSLIIFLYRWTTDVVATRRTKREKNKPHDPSRTR